VIACQRPPPGEGNRSRRRAAPLAPSTTCIASYQDPPGSRVLPGGSWPSWAHRSSRPEARRSLLGSASCRTRRSVSASSRQPTGRTGRKPDGRHRNHRYLGRPHPSRPRRRRIGTINAIYLDDRTGQPEWALANTGLFGTKSSFVPLAQAFQSDNDVLVPYEKQLVLDAPRIDPDGHLSEAEERQLWRHYGLDYDTTDRSVATGRGATGRARGGPDTSGPTTDDAMTRSEEELRVGTTQRERGRVRLRKYVTTE
jgi:hypothetical protein